ncbi:glycoside hydrolase family 55 protein [Baudoinia panamericana UAMH 10762]|uniref:Glycoside hydrolase family 55 protein n=1 Tax=Baudoinia panamericana (strain UAMH 10762) TaxID=717646 RepID=M2MU05_BAUPA|nr:glycoside hydrolase family 55 protein [Baudoinia panamericana UAMH 10762]EMC95018.1 glycoside hydrolase family 55 protein [Baudoinia panamericana UAMH 10762]
MGVDQAPPNTHKHQKRYGSGGTYWYSQIKRQGKVAYGNSSFVIWRNVMDYGAKGDGVTDDTSALNNATTDGNRCGLGCDSSTITPAIVYFPPGTYLISKSIIQYYYTQFVGDANNLPVILAAPNFYGLGLFDSDVYLPYGFSWWTNQNNFFRHIRNFVLDITQTDPSKGVHCLHWQVAQATSLQNIVFNMVEGYLGDNNQQVGIFMDNGSANFFEDLIFNGGWVGFFSGNQQFTVRNLTFNRCETGIFQNWDWVFLYKSITFNDCGVALDMTQGGEIPATGSVILQDSQVINCQYGVLSTFSSTSIPASAGTLVLDNVNFVNTDPAVQYPNGTIILPGNTIVQSFVQGSAYTAYEQGEQIQNLTCWEPTANYSRIQQLITPPPKSASLMDPTGVIYERSRPQYEGVPVESFKSIITDGKCHGDGLTDDTACVQKFFNSILDGQIAYIDHGAYLIRNTINVPINIKMIGEIWPLFMIDGTAKIFKNQSNPQPAFRVGNPGDVGTVEMTEIIFETRGPAPGAVLMEWNLAGTEPMATGMWDVHWRIGGTAGTLLQSDRCTKNPLHAHGANATCWGAFLLVHLTSTASLVMSNNWGWVADHELDRPDHNQVDIYNGRGILVESQGPVWIYGSSFEHSMLYNYQIANAQQVYMGAIQSETMYSQDNPNALSSFHVNDTWSDPTFSECFIATCYKTYGLRIFNSTYIFVYGTGLYSFFNDYDQGCLLTENCQQYMISLEQSEGVYLYAASTKAADSMIEVDQVALVPAQGNLNGFCQTVGVFEYP